ncbi:MAG: hypothetical protein NWS37_05635 [Flavobacteriaceae bacterium]|nr:hypothetical protein [Flavobacteriaceae bacterium]
MKNINVLFKTAAILWVIWGLVHVFAGVITVGGVLLGNTSGAIAGIADDVDPSLVEMDYPAALSAILSQHGFNLFWIGITTFICAFYVWKGNKNAVFLAALVGGLTDLGYFLFLDLGGFVKFMPGTVMTIVSALAIVTSFYAHFKKRQV